MIKNIFLQHKVKNKTNQQSHSTYSEAQSIGVLYNADEFNDEVIDELIDSIEGDGKTISKLGFVDKPTELKLLFSKKDISGTGAIKKDTIHFFVNQHFDFLISIDTSENINYKYVLSLSKAICKVGFETESYSELLQLSLRPEEDKVTSTRNMVKYLKMI